MAKKQPPNPPPVNKRTWLRRKPGETARQWNERTNKSCYCCGVFIADSAALDAHEASHG
jgi:hypothetical protein